MSFLKRHFFIIFPLTFLFDTPLKSSTKELLPVYGYSDIDHNNSFRFSKIQKQLTKKQPSLKIQPFSLCKNDQKAPEEGLMARLERLHEQIKEITKKEPYIMYAAGDDAFVFSKYLEEYDHTAFAAILVNGMLNGCFGQPSKKTHQTLNSDTIIETFLEKKAEEAYKANLEKCLELIKKQQEQEAQSKKGFWNYMYSKGITTTISLASTLIKITPASIQNATPETLLSLATPMFYTKEMQESYLPASFWCDKKNEELYRKISLLARFNNEGTKIEPRYKQNLTKLAYLKLIASPNDQFAKPWYSSLFLSQEPKSLSNFDDMLKKTHKDDDVLGLVEMLKAKKLHLEAIPSGHECHENEEVASAIAKSINYAEKLWLNQK